MSDIDLMEQCQRILPSRTHAAPGPVNTHASTVSQQPAEPQRNAAASHALPVDEAATLPIGEDELSPRTRSFISSQRHSKPASRQLLEAWRAGQADVSPSKLTSGGQQNPTASGSTLASSPHHALLDERAAVRDPQACAAAAASAADTTSAATQLSASLPLENANALCVATPPVPRSRTLLEALLRGRQ